MSETEVKKTVKKLGLKKTAEVKPAEVAEVKEVKQKTSKAKPVASEEAPKKTKKSKSAAPVEATQETPAEPVDHKGSKTTAKNIDAILRVMISKFGLDEKAVRVAIADYLPLTSEFKKKKSKKDPNAPKKACSSYMCFTLKNRPIVVAENKDMAFPEITKELGRRWGKLTLEEKQPYVEQSRQAALEYKKKDAEYRKEKGLPEKVEKVKKEVVAASS